MSTLEIPGPSLCSLDLLVCSWISEEYKSETARGIALSEMSKNLLASSRQWESIDKNSQVHIENLCVTSLPSF